jgi:SAM-dependent MidA family methyltransferase
METRLSLPDLMPEEAAHAQRVAVHLTLSIQAAGGVWPFPAFMAAALYAPGLGYYAAGARKFGASGDFITAPEVSPVFGSCVARQIAEVLGHLRATGSGPLTLVEYGAGSGALMVDILLTLAQCAALPEVYAIVEVSPDLRERQAAAVAALPEQLRHRVTWWPGHASHPWRGVLLANEVLDALPTERLRVTAAGIERMQVVVQERSPGTFAPVWTAPDAALESWWAATRAQLSEPLLPGSQLEACLVAGPWVQEALATLEAGVALYIDYGLPRSALYAPARAQGTFSAFFRHRQHADAFWCPGLQDLTAWVDFTAVAEAGLAAGATVAGFATQAQFLVNSGLEAVFAAQAAVSVGGPALARLAQGVQQLVMPQEMGERFKVLALAKGYDTPLGGFGRRDLTATL